MKKSSREILNEINEGIHETPFKRVNLRVFQSLGAVAGGLTTILAYSDALYALRKHDVDSAVSMFASALTGTALTAISIGQIFVQSWATALGGPVTWILIAASIGFALLSSYLRDKPLDDWVLHGPFGKKQFSGNYQAWEDSSELCHQALLSQLIRPQLTLSEENNPVGTGRIVVATLILPHIPLQYDEIYIHTTHEKREEKLPPNSTIGMIEPSEVVSRQEIAELLDIESEYNLQGHLISIRYLYNIPKAPKYEISNYTWRSRVQLKSENLTLPLPYKPNLFGNIPEKTPISIRDDQINWFQCTEKLITSPNILKNT